MESATKRSPSRAADAVTTLTLKSCHGPSGSVMQRRGYLWARLLLLQLRHQLAHVGKVRALGDDLLRRAPDELGVSEPDRKETQRVLRIEIAPCVGQVPDDIVHDLFVVSWEAGDVLVRRTCFVLCHGIGGTQHGARYALGSNWVLARPVAVRDELAAVVLRPRSVHRRIEDDFPRILRVAPQLRPKGGRRDKCLGSAINERVAQRVEVRPDLDKIHLSARVNTDEREQHREEAIELIGRILGVDGYRLATQI